jgi:hypothetical protein
MDVGIMASEMGTTIMYIAGTVLPVIRLIAYLKIFQVLKST